MSSQILADLLVTPTYHERLRQHLQSEEPELWSWFAEAASPTRAAIEETELDLLNCRFRRRS